MTEPTKPEPGEQTLRPTYTKNGYWRCICGVIAMPLTDDTDCDCGDIYSQEWNFVEVQPAPAEPAGVEEEVRKWKGLVCDECLGTVASMSEKIAALRSELAEVRREMAFRRTGTSANHR